MRGIKETSGADVLLSRKNLRKTSEGGGNYPPPPLCFTIQLGNFYEGVNGVNQ